MWQSVQTAFNFWRIWTSIFRPIWPTDLDKYIQTNLTDRFSGNRIERKIGFFLPKPRKSLLIFEKVQPRKLILVKSFKTKRFKNKKFSLIKYFSYCHHRLSLSSSLSLQLGFKKITYAWTYKLLFKNTLYTQWLIKISVKYLKNKNSYIQAYKK